MQSKTLLVSSLLVLILSLDTGSAEIAGMKRIGCFKDMPDRDLLGTFTLHSMTREFCVNHCKKKGFFFAGLQAGRECGCGNKVGRYGTVNNLQCRERCSGDPSVTCGGKLVNEIFKTGLKIDGMKRIGCFKDMPDRDLFGKFSQQGMTREFCVNHCKTMGFYYAGLQAHRECSCGNKFGRYGPENNSECREKCSGDPSETCGGNWANEIFETGLKIDGMKGIGCFKDMPERDLLGIFHAFIMTREFCVNYCKSKEYMFAGVQARGWCSCSNWYGRYGQVNDSVCREKCLGDPSVTCGGNMENEMFETGLRVAYMQRIGCFKDRPDRDMPVFFRLDSMTRKLCVDRCGTYGFMFAGLQARTWCSCGDDFGRYGPMKNSECRQTCLGDPRETCGGDMQNEVFTTGLMKSPWKSLLRAH